MSSRCICLAKSPTCLQRSVCVISSVRTTNAAMQERYVPNMNKGWLLLLVFGGILGCIHDFNCLHCSKGCRYMLIRQIGKHKVATLKRVPKGEELARYQVVCLFVRCFIFDHPAYWFQLRCVDVSNGRAWRQPWEMAQSCEDTWQSYPTWPDKWYRWRRSSLGSQDISGYRRGVFLYIVLSSRVPLSCKL